MSTPDAMIHLVSGLMSADAVSLQLHHHQREDLLAELVDRVEELSGRDEARRQLLTALEARERLQSTGIGEGIALPHARNLPADLVTRACIVFGRHPTGVRYGAPDNQPVRLFLLLITVSITQHLQILARVSRLLRQPGLRDALLAARHPEEVIEAVRQAELG